MTDSTPSIALLGATRGIGRILLDRALARGHRVRALVRPGRRLEVDHAHLTVVPGDATNADDVARALEGADAVLSALGAPARSQVPVRTQAAEATVAAMRAAGVTRLIAVSVYGAAETRAHLPFFTRAVVFPLFLRRAIADHETQEAAIRHSGLDWTILRPPYLTDGPATGDYAIDFGDRIRGLTWTISREDVADAMLDALERRRHVRAAVGLSYRKASRSAA